MIFSFSEVFGGKEVLQREVVSLKVELDRLDCPLVMSHNDLLLGNVIYDEDSGEWVWLCMSCMVLAGNFRQAIVYRVSKIMAYNFRPKLLASM